MTHKSDPSEQFLSIGSNRTQERQRVKEIIKLYVVSDQNNYKINEIMEGFS
jgi:hypothetical protein